VIIDALFREMTEHQDIILLQLFSDNSCEYGFVIRDKIVFLTSFLGFASKE